MTINAADVGVVLDFTVNRPDGTPYNLSGATVVLLSTELNSTSSLADKTCTIVDAALGTCRLTTVAGEFGSGGQTYSARLKVSASGGVVLHSSRFTIVVNA